MAAKSITPPRLLDHADTVCGAPGCAKHGAYCFGHSEIRRFCADHRDIGVEWWAGVTDASPTDAPALRPSAAIKQGRLL